MNSLAKKLADRIIDGKSHVYLTGKELVSLAKSRRVARFSLLATVDPFTEVDGLSYYPGWPTTVKLTRRDALKIAKNFAEYATDSEKGPLYARVYVTPWSDAGRLYVSF